MTDTNHFDVIIVGGSYAGLSAAMALGRSLRNVLVIDSGKPCNRQTPHSHNFITQDGVAPKKIAEAAKEQVLEYDTVKYRNGLVTKAGRLDTGFEVVTDEGERFRCEKVLFATGVEDLMPETAGFSECWGISVLHCPYCHGYEVRNENIGILAKGEMATELCRLIQNWSKTLTLYTNGTSDLSREQRQMLDTLNINVVEKEIAKLHHNSGYVQEIVFNDGTLAPVSALFARVGFRQHCDIPEKLGCELTEQGHLEVNFMGKTSVAGVFAAGDNTTPFRSVSLAVSAGTVAGAAINMELIEEEIGS